MKKKILCLTIPSLQAGGMERVMSELASYFYQNQRLDVHLILYGKAPEIFYVVPDNLKIHQPVKSFDNRFRLIYAIGRLIFLRKCIKRLKPDSVLSFGEYWNSFVLLALLGLSYPVFISDRCSPEERFGVFHSFLRRTLYPQSKGIIAQTEKAKELFLTRNNHSNISVISNPIRSIGFSGKEIKREKCVLMVGRLIESKHQDMLIEMFSKVNLPEWNLILVGYDHLKQSNMQRLKALAKELNIEKRVIFMGKQRNIEEIYNRSSVFAFTSSSEGFPNAIGEAMSAGLPVVAFDCIAGPSDLITNDLNGFLIPLFDNNLFQERLRLLMMDENLRERLGKNALESVKAFSIQSIGEQFSNFILTSK